MVTPSQIFPAGLVQPRCIAFSFALQSEQVAKFCICVSLQRIISTCASLGCRFSSLKGCRQITPVQDPATGSLWWPGRLKAVKSGQLTLLCISLQDPSILHFLLASGDEISSKQLRDDLMTMLIAGHETTAAVLTWTLHCCSTRPDVVQRMQQEVRHSAPAWYDILRAAEEGGVVGSAALR